MMMDGRIIYEAHGRGEEGAHGRGAGGNVFTSSTTRCCSPDPCGQNSLKGATVGFPVDLLQSGPHHPCLQGIIYGFVALGRHDPLPHALPSRT